MDDLEQKIATVDSTRIALENVEPFIEDIVDADLQEIETSCPPIESAKLNVGLAYTLASLYYISLRLKGRSTKEHPIQKDINRIKVNAAEINKASGENESSSKKTIVNVEATKRVISHELKSNNKKKKRKE